MNVRALILTFGLLPVLTATAAASPIPVANFSFETLPPGGLPFGCAGTGCAFSEGPIPGWTNSGVSGQFQPRSNTLYFNFIPDGIRVAYSNDPGGTITQTVGRRSRRTQTTHCEWISGCARMVSIRSEPYSCWSVALPSVRQAWRQALETGRRSRRLTIQ